MELDKDPILEAFAEFAPEMAEQIRQERIQAANTPEAKKEIVKSDHPTPVAPKGTRTKAPSTKRLHTGMDGNRVTGSQSLRKEHKPASTDIMTIDFEEVDGQLTLKNPLDFSSDAGAAYELITAIARDLGYHFRFDPKGVLNNHTLYVEDRPQDIPGLKTPSSFRVKRQGTWAETLDCLRKLRATVYGVVVGALEKPSHDIADTKHESRYVEDDGKKLVVPIDYTDDADAAGAGKKRMKYAAQILRLVDGFTESRATSFAAAGSVKFRLSQTSNAEKQWNATGLGCSPVGTKWVPDLGWFDRELSEISDEQLLPLLSAPEREVFMLQMGRSLLGLEGDLILLPGGRLTRQNAKWRIFSVWEGRKGGLGRSTTLGYLSEGFGYLGYSVKAAHDFTSKFGQGGNATADWLFLDDLSPEDTTRLFGSGVLKSLVGGGNQISVEDKGVDSYTVIPRMTATLCTNIVNPANFAGMDDGVRSRIAVMRNRTGLDQESRDYLAKYGYPVNVDRTYGALCDQYSVTEQTLVLLLLARCAQKFLPFATATDRNAGLVAHLDQLRSQFKVRVTLDYVDGVLEHYAKALKVRDIGEDGTTGFILRDLFSTIEAFEYMQIPRCSDSYKELLEYIKEARRGNKGVARAAATFFASLTSDDGFSYPTDISFWTAAWNEYRESYDWSLPPVIDNRGLPEKRSERTPEMQAKQDALNKFLDKFKRD